ncbi:alkaline phosphatase D family protein [Streptomyces hoynatensis]|uniref:alkaline phosphatase D family protein n=1 Tax=Streptomyces hoynatensis TaxID=1141874 RepID=UPI0019D4A49D|nr:alkaline phosphatase D family protein [Streptomyces hoynatensis]
MAAGRRRFLTGTGAAAALALSGGLAGVATADGRARGRERRDPFTLGVASGDPLPDGVVLWTRLAPEPLEPYGGMPRSAVQVEWQVAEDERFRRVVRAGSATARPEYSHTVHVDVRGLRPWRHYHYRFRVGGQLSPVGRTRTAPSPGTEVPALDLAFASCQNWTAGFYPAHGDLAARDHDVVFFLGDYIYENPIPVDGGARGQQVPAEVGVDCVTLDDYRLRYALYKQDPDLKAAHAAAPWVVTLDDHEVENDWAPRDSAEWVVRQANAFRAYWEHMPLRWDRLPQGPDLPLYRRLAFGRLAEFSVLDTRQYRSHADGGWRAPDADTLDPARTLIGQAQERWILDGLGASSARWNVLAQQVLMMPTDAAAGAAQSVAMGTWSGYSASRDRVLGGLHERGVDNLVVLTGDVHANFAGDLRRDFGDPSSPVVGSELVCTSISSDGDGADADDWTRTILAENPHVAYANHERGYVSCRITPREWTAHYRVADTVTRRDAAVRTRKSLVIGNGVAGIRD